LYVENQETGLRDFLKRLAGSVSADNWERLLTYSILDADFSAAVTSPVVPTREDLWHIAEQQCAGADGAMLFVEYGVHEGYSIKRFASRNRHPDSRFIGLDSFEGLPEDWRSGAMVKGAFDVSGAIPKVDDPRIEFVKGWFQKTARQLHDRLLEHPTLPMIVHYDADLYSSTVFALAQMAGLRSSYLAIFDEFTGHEARALYNFKQAFGVSIEFIAQTQWRGRYPQQVLCRITSEA
jgi:hypothetical protein